MALRQYANAPATTLVGTITALATALTVTSVTGLPISYPYILILDRATASEEVVLVTAGTGANLTVTRGYDSTTAFSHSAGAVVEHGISAIDPREANAHVNATGTGLHGRTGNLVGDSDAQTLTNKTISADNNTISGIAASSFVLSNGSGNLDGSASQKVVPAGVVIGTTDSQTLTNKTVALGSNTVSGTKAQFNTAMTDADFATIDGTETLTNKTLASPVVTGPGSIKRALKTASEQIVSNAVLQDDDELSFTLEAGTWLLDLALFVNAGNDTPDIKVFFNFGGTQTYLIMGVVAATPGTTSVTNTSMKLSANNSGGSIPVGVNGLVLGTLLAKGAITVTVAGTMTLQWAQDTSSAQALTVVQGSWFRAERVA